MLKVIEPFIIRQFAASLVVSMSISHKIKNRSPLGLYFRFHCIIIIGCDGICGSDTREALWAAQAWVGLCPVTCLNHQITSLYFSFSYN